MDKSLTDVRDLIQNNSHLYDFAADFAAVCASAASLDFENLGGMHCKLISIVPRQLSSKHPPSVRTQPLIRNILHCSLVQN